MVKAGWSLTQQDGIFTAFDGRRHVVFSIPADHRGLYYLASTVISRNPSTTRNRIRGQRNAQISNGDPQKRSASHFFGPNGENVQVKALHSEVACRLDQREIIRCDSHVNFPPRVRESESETISNLSPLIAHAPGASVSHLSAVYDQTKSSLLGRPSDLHALFEGRCHRSSPYNLF